MGTSRPHQMLPPRDQSELEARAHRLAGRTVAELARAMGIPAPETGVRTKGKLGTLVEKLLGATAGATARPDFPDLGIELKTIPIDDTGRPHESTFVCTLSLANADTATWETSLVRAKLAHVLWVPIVGRRGAPASARRVGAPVFWRPSPEEEAVLRADFEEIVGRIGIGGIELLTARAGRWLQVRPKAATGRVRTWSFGPEGEPIATVPRGFYLRTRFTEGLLRARATGSGISGRPRAPATRT